MTSLAPNMEVCIIHTNGCFSDIKWMLGLDIYRTWLFLNHTVKRGSSYYTQWSLLCAPNGSLFYHFCTLIRFYLVRFFTFCTLPSFTWSAFLSFYLFQGFTNGPLFYLFVLYQVLPGPLFHER